MPSALTDTELLEVERRARAALRTEPPTLTPEGGDRYALEAQREVIDFIREVGPPVVLRLAEEIRRLKAEQEKLMGRLRSVETWNIEP